MHGVRHTSHWTATLDDHCLASALRHDACSALMARNVTAVTLHFALSLHASVYTPQHGIFPRH
jgi:hypothetical protein